jgi:hypothetical protein
MTPEPDTSVAGRLGIGVRLIRRVLDATPHSHIRKGRQRLLLPHHVTILLAALGNQLPPGRPGREFAALSEALTLASASQSKWLTEPGRVYFITAAERDLVKVGFSKHPEARLGGLQRSHATELRLVGSVQGCRQDEFGIHSILRGFRVQREWFRSGPWLAIAISVVAEGGSPSDMIYRLRGLQ